jgi:hypothetical protein
MRAVPEKDEVRRKNDEVRSFLFRFGRWIDDLHNRFARGISEMVRELAHARDSFRKSTATTAGKADVRSKN